MEQGNFKLNSLTIVIDGEEVPVSPNNVLALRYVEDIRRASVHLDITLTDSEGGELSKIFGNELIGVEFEDHKGNVIALDLIVYQVANREIVGGKQSKGTLKCCNRDITNSAGLLISSQYEDKNITEIVEGLLKEPLVSQIPVVKMDKCINKITFATNYWNPIKIIQWLTDKAIYAESSGKSATAGFVFFETRRGYHWRALDSLVKDKPRYQLKMGVEVEPEDLDAGTLIELSNINVKETSNVLQGFNYGSYVSRVTTFDIGTQSVDDFDFSAKDLYNDIPKLNEGELPRSYDAMSTKTPTRIMTKVMNSKLYNAGEYTKDLTKILSQASFRNKMFYNKEVEAEFIGDQTIEVGDVVELENYIGRSREKDPVNSGKYIVGKILREYNTTDSNMKTRLTLYNDSLGTGTETSTNNAVSGLLG